MLRGCGDSATATIMRLSYAILCLLGFCSRSFPFCLSHSLCTMCSLSTLSLLSAGWSSTSLPCFPSPCVCACVHVSTPAQVMVFESEGSLVARMASDFSDGPLVLHWGLANSRNGEWQVRREEGSKRVIEYVWDYSMPQNARSYSQPDAFAMLLMVCTAHSVLHACLHLAVSLLCFTLCFFSPLPTPPQTSPQAPPDGICFTDFERSCETEFDPGFAGYQSLQVGRCATQQACQAIELLPLVACASLRSFSSRAMLNLHLFMHVCVVPCSSHGLVSLVSDTVLPCSQWPLSLAAWSANSVVCRLSSAVATVGSRSRATVTSTSPSSCRTQQQGRWW